ncbi:MAG: endosialidase [Lachnospiraceae bacterium]|jgi:hypothetical protein|nr:endosialidase [Lachnospiraceae bacterium]
MAVVKELIRPEEDGSISFGDYELSQKTKKSDVEVHGDSYKVKTFREVTRLECNDMLVYESEPGTAVSHFQEDETGVTFRVEGPEDAQIILGLADNASYRVCIDGEDQGIMETGMGGKLVLSVELQAAESVLVEVKKD